VAANPLIGALPLWKHILKRTVDIGAAVFGLLLLAPLLLGVALLVLFGSGIPILHREPRIGRHGRPFTLLKFRTLKRKSATNNSIVAEDDPRITRVGRPLRRSRLDELPQLFNVLRGDMSLVGPRPMVAHHLNALDRSVCEALLSVRPGVTDPASVLYFAEAAVLAGRPNAEAEYLEVLLPAKVRVQLNYLWHWRPWLDIRIIFQTLARVWSHDAREKSMQLVRALLANGAEADRQKDPVPPLPPP
jgi:lipopolysaccharide/colanic/teichoic acid biosynthesis glycosyltransferase